MSWQKITVLSDIFIVVAAFFAAYSLRNWVSIYGIFDYIQPLKTYLAALPFAIALLLIIFSFLGLYEKRVKNDQFRQTYLIVKGTFLWILLIMAGSYIYKYDYSRIITVLFWFFTLIFISLVRTLLHFAAKNFSASTSNNFWRVAIIGSNEKARVIHRQLLNYQKYGIEVVGFFRPEEIMNAVLKHNIHEVYIADTGLQEEKLLNLIASCPYEHVNFRVATTLFDFALKSHAGLYNIDEIPSLNIKKLRPNPLYLAAKRALDILISLLGLTVSILFWPIIIMLIRFDSPGKAVIIQGRVGLNGKIFKMYKFRTMHADVKFYAPAPRNEKDERITRIGKWLRKTSLDELPQLLNVLKGEMSIVGPRPEMPFIVEKYKPWQKKRLEVKPGLTGLWQILGRKDLPLDENLQYDFYYINNQSLLLDLTIILKTMPYVIFGKGAY